MDKFEYAIDGEYQSNHGGIFDMLQRRGKNGWELVSTITVGIDSSYINYYFKRKYIEELNKSFPKDIKDE